MVVSEALSYLWRERMDINSGDNNSTLWYAFSKSRPELGLNKDDYRRIMKQFWDFVGDLFVETEHGILLDGIGYFALPVFGHTSHLNRKQVFFLPKDTPIYEPYFFNQVFDDYIWNSYRFKPATKIKKGMLKALKEGKKYKCHYHHLERLSSANSKYYYNSSKRKKRR